jgi:hypothetical protein
MTIAELLAPDGEHVFRCEFWSVLGADLRPAPDVPTRMPLLEARLETTSAARLASALVKEVQGRMAGMRDSRCQWPFE